MSRTRSRIADTHPGLRPPLRGGELPPSPPRRGAALAAGWVRFYIARPASHRRARVGCLPPASPWQRAGHAVRRFLADCRGAAALETALGTGVIITVTALFFDIYQLAAAKHSLLHDAISVGDYVSRDEEISATHIQDLSAFLHKENYDPLNASFRVSAFRAESATKVNRLWTEEAKFGTESTALTTCAQASTTPPNGLTLKAGETAIVAKVCVEQDDESVLHASYLIQSRASEPPRLVRNAE